METQARILTERQTEVLELASRGYTNAHIAREMFIAQTTVWDHMKRLREALGARDRAHAVRRGFELGILTVDSPGV